MSLQQFCCSTYSTSHSTTTQLFFYFLQIYNLLYKLSNKQICYKETRVRSNHPMMILLCILYVMLCVRLLFFLSTVVFFSLGLAKSRFSFGTHKTFITVRLMRVCCWRRRSLWREDGSAVYNFCWASPAQLFCGPSPAGLMAVFLKKKTIKLRGLSPRANYTDRMTSACRRSWCQL
jgi:hypothetical protein